MLPRHHRSLPASSGRSQQRSCAATIPCQDCAARQPIHTMSTRRDYADRQDAQRNGMRRLLANIVASLGTALIATSCTQTAPSPAAPTPGAVPAATARQALEVTELERRILDYADAMHRSGDITTDSFEKAIGVSLSDSEKSSTYATSPIMPLTGGYAFTAQLMDDRNGAQAIINMGMMDGRGMTEVPDPGCILDGEAFSQALEQRGYRRTVTEPIGSRWLREHHRTMSGSESMFADVRLYRIKGGHLCVHRIELHGQTHETG